VLIVLDRSQLCEEVLVARPFGGTINVDVRESQSDWGPFEQLENTMIVVVSDNGASGEGGPNGSVNEMEFANGIPDDLEQNLEQFDELGGPRTYNHYATGWAMAFNTPFKMWKRYEFNGGTSDPCIISWPAGTKARGELREQYYQAIDLVPTILDIVGVDGPETIKGHTQSHFDGVSMSDSIDDASAASNRSTQFYAMLGSRSIWHEGWKAVTTTRVSPAGGTSTTTSGSSTTPTATGLRSTTSPASPLRRSGSSWARRCERQWEAVHRPRASCREAAQTPMTGCARLGTPNAIRRCR
jgi:arylsulfatase A-like enzyme